MDVGVDTHKQSHGLLALDERGQTFGSKTVPNTPEGWASALAWRRGWAQACLWGIGNGGSLGKGFARSLPEQGESRVREAVPHRTAQ
jgi:transposase